MKRNVLLALIISVAFAACKKNENNNAAQNKARVMFVNGAMDADSLRGRINSTNVTTVPFLGNSGYINVDPVASATLDFTFTGSGSVFASTSGSLTANNTYSLFAGGDASNKVTILRSDDLSAPNAGKSKVRFVHLSSNTPDAVAYVGSVTVDTNIAFGTATNFKEVNAGTATITMAALPAVATLNNFSLSAGKIYTFIFTGTISGSGNNAPRLTPINNN